MIRYFCNRGTQKVRKKMAQTNEAPQNAECFSCGGCAFRSDRPYGNFCSMMCALRGIPTEAEKKEEDKKWELITERWAASSGGAAAEVKCVQCTRVHRPRQGVHTTECGRCADGHGDPGPLCDACVFPSESYGQVCEECHGYLEENQ